MTEKRFENRLNKSDIKFNTLNPVWDNEKETALNVFEMIDLLNEQHEQIERLKRNFKALDEIKCELAGENEQLKSDNNRLVNETAKIVAEHQRKVFDLIDEKIEKYSPKYRLYNTNAIEVLEELKKELSE